LDVRLFCDEGDGIWENGPVAVGGIEERCPSFAVGHEPLMVSVLNVNALSNEEASDFVPVDV